MRPGPKVPGILGPLQRQTVMLDELSITMLSAVGDGNLSAGIRQAARTAYDRYQRTPDVPTRADAVERLLERPAQLEYDSWDCRVVRPPPTSTPDSFFRLCVRCLAPGDRVVVGTGYVCAKCATDDEVEL